MTLEVSDYEDYESPKRRPGLTPEARENQLISLAIDLAEKQLMEGTASSQVITHYLKLGTTRERLEQEILRKQSTMLDAKTEALKAEQNKDEAYTKAIEAFKRYSGHTDDETDLQ